MKFSHSTLGSYYMPDDAAKVRGLNLMPSYKAFALVHKWFKQREAIKIRAKGRFEVKPNGRDCIEKIGKQNSVFRIFPAPNELGEIDHTN
jgi:hypothetical protein